MPLQRLAARGLTVYATADRRTYELPTGSVIVAIYAANPTLARRALAGLATLNGTVLPGERLPPPTRTAYAQTPLSSQLVVVKSTSARTQSPRPAKPPRPAARR